MRDLRVNSNRNIRPEGTLFQGPPRRARAPQEKSRQTLLGAAHAVLTDPGLPPKVFTKEKTIGVPFPRKGEKAMDLPLGIRHSFPVAPLECRDEPNSRP